MAAINLGADPELALIGNHGQARSARSYLRGGLEAKVGHDGAGVPAEIRPGCAATPLDLIAKCRDALADLAKELRPVLATGEIRRVSAGSFAQQGVALGGHVHVSLPHSAGDRLRRAADRLAADWWDGVEVEKARRSREGRGYGRSDSYPWKAQPHGGCEYRVLGSWLAHPAVAIAAVSLVTLAARIVEAGDEGRIPNGVTPWPARIDAIEAAGLVPDECRDGIAVARKLWDRGPHTLTACNVLRAWEVRS